MKSRTRQGRLAALDIYLSEREPIRASDVFIDLGFGERPVTTLETANALPFGTVIGMEADQRFALAAASSERKGVRFIHGDFSALPLLPRARVVRVMNVLRSHREEEVAGIHALLLNALVDGGLLVEGSADPDGSLLCAHLIRRRGDVGVREGLLFFTSFAHGFAPIQFRDWLPRDLRRGVRPETWIASVFERWTSAWQAVRSDDPRGSFIRSCEALSRRGEPVDAALAPRGFLIWRPGVRE